MYILYNVVEPDEAVQYMKLYVHIIQKDYYM